MEDSIQLFAFAGLAAGLIHALSGPDHLSAVAPLTLEERRGRWRTGLSWGAGHSLGVWLVGLLVLALRGVFPLESLSSWSERLVGAVLIAVGLWGLRKASVARLPQVREAEQGSGDHAHGGRPGWAAFSVGTLHGLAGSAHLVGLFPALALPSRSASIAYVAGFGFGTVAAMVAFTSALGLVATRITARGERAYQALLASFSAAAIVIGGYWLMA